MNEQTETTPTGKGRPTPKRKDAQKARTGPVTPPPANRREAAKQLREKQAENRKQVKLGNRTGDDSVLLPRDRGPVRGLVRDIVDSRRSLGFLLMPAAGATIIANFTNNAPVQAAALGLWVAVIVGVALDMAWAGRLISKALRTAFPDERRRGHLAYGLLRTTVIRRFRMPRPQVPRSSLR